MTNIAAMGTHEASAALLAAVEDAVHRAEFLQVAEVDEETRGMAALYAQMFRLQQEMAVLQAQLAEVLRRLPERQ